MHLFRNNFIHAYFDGKESHYNYEFTITSYSAVFLSLGQVVSAHDKSS